MDTRAILPNRQRGVMLLEALISILIFSLGILAIVGLQAAAVKNAGDAKYRTDASLLTSSLIAQMWASDRTQATLKANFQTGGNQYYAWINTIICPPPVPPATLPIPALPGVDCSSFPVSAANPTLPTVSIVADNSTVIPSNVVTITLYWNAPSEQPQAHQLVSVAQINQ